MWDEYEELFQFPKSICDCARGAVKAHEEYEDFQKLAHFLIGLNSSFTQTRGQILIIKPLPLIDEDLSILLQEEQQRGGHANFTGSTPTHNLEFTKEMHSKGRHTSYNNNNIIRKA